MSLGNARLSIDQVHLHGPWITDHMRFTFTETENLNPDLSRWPVRHSVECTHGPRQRVDVRFAEILFVDIQSRRRLPVPPFVRLNTTQHISQFALAVEERIGDVRGQGKRDQNLFQRPIEDRIEDRKQADQEMAFGMLQAQSSSELLAHPRSDRTGGQYVTTRLFKTRKHD